MGKCGRSSRGGSARRPNKTFGQRTLVLLTRSVISGKVVGRTMLTTPTGSSKCWASLNTRSWWKGARLEIRKFISGAIRSIGLPLCIDKTGIMPTSPILVLKIKLQVKKRARNVVASRIHNIKKDCHDHSFPHVRFNESMVALYWQRRADRSFCLAPIRGASVTFNMACEKERADPKMTSI